MSALRAWVLRFSGLFHKEQRDRELDEEFQSHLEMQVEDNLRRGMTLEEARRDARLKFGGIESAKESYRDQRGLPWLDDSLQDTRFGLRMLRKAPMFALVAVFTLALGIGASTVVFSLFYSLTFNSFMAKDARRLVVPIIPSIHAEDLDAIRAQSKGFEGIVGWTNGIVLVDDGIQTHQFYDARVTSDAFEFYGVSPLLGRGISAGDGNLAAPPVFAMSYGAWKTFYNSDPKVLGKVFTIDGETRTLVGVMPPRFHAFGPLADVWIPLNSTETASDRGLPLTGLLARLKTGETLANASAEFRVITQRLAAQHPSDFPKHFDAEVQLASEAVMGPLGLGSLVGSGFNFDLKRLLLYLLFAVGLLLLIACSNVANLLLARATIREREIAVRAALGATRGRIVRQLLIEGLLLALPACIVGCLLAEAGLKLVTIVLPQNGFMGQGSAGALGGELSVGLSPTVLYFAVGVTLLSTLLTSLIPALYQAQGGLQSHLAEAGKGVSVGVRHGILRNVLVVGEVALSIVLLTCSGLMVRGFVNLTRVDLGFSPQNILVVYFTPYDRHQGPDVARIASPQRTVIFRKVVERLKNLPGVKDVAVEDTIPGYGPQSGPEVTIPGTGHSEVAGFEGCDEKLLGLLDLRLLRGSWLSEGDVEKAQHVAVINEKLAHDFFGDQSPVGQQLEVKEFRRPMQAPQDAYFQIVGVIGDVKTRGFQQPALPMVFIPNTISGSFFLLLKTSVKPSSLKHAVQEQVWTVDRGEVLWILDPLESFIQSWTYAIPELGLSISGLLAVLALILVAIGIFSVMAYTTSLRNHEIGIRMALGARRSNILGMILTKGLRLTVIGVVVGVVASLGVTRFLANQIWGVSPTDSWAFGTTIVIILTVGLVACFLPARRATKVDPMVTLRYE